MVYGMAGSIYGRLIQISTWGNRTEGDRCCDRRVSGGAFSFRGGYPGFIWIEETRTKPVYNRT